ncbi:cell division protein FtsZ [bacterium]|nr:cell division protein FtsZ [bacterium]
MENIISNLDTTRSGINPTRIKVAGVGGGGGNAVDRMVKAKLAGVDFWLMNTDLQVLNCSNVQNKLQLGVETTRGLGSGGDPAVGEKAATEVKEQIAKALDNTDMLFITAGMGGGTGTGAAPIVAQVAHDLGILTIAFVTKPFRCEGKKRMAQAEAGIEKLKKYVDAILVVPNDKLLQVVERQIGVREAFCVTDEVLYRGIQGLTDIITVPGMINIDFADVRKVVKDSGTALMGIGRAQGEGRAIKAAEMAINSQLLESSIDGASGIIVNITGSSNMTLFEINDATNVINNVVKDDADVIIGTSINEAFQNEIQITVIATGFAEKSTRGAIQMSAAEYFSGQSNSASNTPSTSNIEFPKFSLDVPDFLKKD